GILAPMKNNKTTKNKTRKAKPETPGNDDAQKDVAASEVAVTKSRPAAKPSRAASPKTSSAKPKSSSPTTQSAPLKAIAKTKKPALPEAATAAQTGRVANEEASQEQVADGISKADIKEAARILKSGGSKKRERRKAASVMSVAGSSKGGQNRARNLSPEKLKEIATLGGLARQAKARERAEQGLSNARPRRAPMARSLSGGTS
ncbi:MAG TPA: hypothetical protein VM821_03070, partial [Abditibacteriaceae bacterium]|nr:hypothetical protein [Abditibacteriaceae bacterium]